MRFTEAKTLLTSLLERLDADAQSDRPLFGGFVSDSDRTALRVALAELETRASDPPPIEPPPPPAETLPTRSVTPIALNTSILDEEIPATNWVLCLDFGTAKSKAFAATQTEDPNLLELPIGTADQDPDVYSVSSSVWIEDDGLAFVGSEAVKRGRAVSTTLRQPDSAFTVATPRW